MIDHGLDIILTVVVLSFWFLFPIGMFLSMSHVDKNTDQIIRLNKLRQESTKAGAEEITPETDTGKRRPGDYRRPKYA